MSPSEPSLAAAQPGAALFSRHAPAISHSHSLRLPDRTRHGMVRRAGLRTTQGIRDIAVGTRGPCRVNVLNDYYDALNGTDDINTDTCPVYGRPPLHPERCAQQN